MCACFIGWILRGRLIVDVICLDKTALTALTEPPVSRITDIKTVNCLYVLRQPFYISQGKKDCLCIFLCLSHFRSVFAVLNQFSNLIWFETDSTRRVPKFVLSSFSQLVLIWWNTRQSAVWDICWTAAAAVGLLCRGGQGAFLQRLNVASLQSVVTNACLRIGPACCCR